MNSDDDIQSLLREIRDTHREYVSLIRENVERSREEHEWQREQYKRQCEQHELYRESVAIQREQHAATREQTEAHQQHADEQKRLARRDTYAIMSGCFMMLIIVAAVIGVVIASGLGYLG